MTDLQTLEVRCWKRSPQFFSMETLSSAWKHALQAYFFARASTHLPPLLYMKVPQDLNAATFVALAFLAAFFFTPFFFTTFFFLAFFLPAASSTLDSIPDLPLGFTKAATSIVDAANSAANPAMRILVFRTRNLPYRHVCVDLNSIGQVTQGILDTSKVWQRGEGKKRLGAINPKARNNKRLGTLSLPLPSSAASSCRSLDVLQHVRESEECQTRCRRRARRQPLAGDLAEEDA